MKKTVLASLICTLLLSGCAATQATSDTNPETAANAAASTENTAAKAQEKPQAAAEKSEGPVIPAQCRTEIASYIPKADGSIEILTADNDIRRIDASGIVTDYRKLPDSAQNYFLLPTENVILHIHADRIMLENKSNTELFKLKGDAAKKTIYYSNDASELAILDTVDGKERYNVWNTQKGFGGITENERVQDFINRQSPDHNLGFPNIVRAVSLGLNGNIAVAIDDPEQNKSGLLYKLDTVNEPGRLKILARTNSLVKKVIISDDAAYVAAFNTSGQLFFTPTDNPGFILFAQKYTDVKDITFYKKTLIVIGASKLTAIDNQNGTSLYEINSTDKRCVTAGEKLICASKDLLDIRNPLNGKLIKRFAFSGESYSLVTDDKLDGTCK
ncbi:MAG: hypothetical protein IJ268_06575 [Proteobacteria bacterium]|nr:hypothetical protein [Pseudomonadota bacterium]